MVRFLVWVGKMVLIGTSSTIEYTHWCPCEFTAGIFLVMISAKWTVSKVAPKSMKKGSARGPMKAGSLKVVTTHLTPGYLRKNGVPYSANTVVTEYYSRTHEDNGDSWLIITTIVDDPMYLQQPFITSTHFKLEPNGSKWMPSACEAK